MTIPLPESFLILSRLQSGTEEVCRLDEAIAYGDAVRAEDRERAAQICDGFASCEGIAQQCAQAIRNAVAQREP